MKKLLIFILFVVGAVYQLAAQCPMCKASVESSQSVGNKSVGMGLNMGILMLLVSVYVILFSVGIMWYRKYRKNQLTENAV